MRSRPTGLDAAPPMDPGEPDPYCDVCSTDQAPFFVTVLLTDGTTQEGSMCGAHVPFKPHTGVRMVAVEALKRTGT